MFSFQTLTCLQNIPVVRSSTNKLHDVYAKAKDTSVLIRLPCSLAETVADKSLQVALTIANPFVKPLRGPVRVIDDFAAQKIRQFESKYPAINTPTKDVVNTLNEKTEPVRNALNSVKGTTTSTIQHGKETVSNVASATVNKASGVADSLFSFCETHVPGINRHDTRQTTGFIGRVFSPIGCLYDCAFQSIQSSVLWFRMLVVFFLLKIKQINDIVLHKIQHKPYLTVLPQQLLIIAGGFLDYFIGRIRPDDRTLADLKKPKQQSRLSQHQQPQHHVNRSNHKTEPSITTRQSVVVTQEETVVTRTNNYTAAPKSQPNFSNMTDKEELYARLAANSSRQSAHHVDHDTHTSERVVPRTNKSSAASKAHPDYSNMTDKEELYARLAANDSHQSAHHVDHDTHTSEPVVTRSNKSTAVSKAQHAHSNMTDKEELHTRSAANDSRQSAHHVHNDTHRTQSVDDVSNSDINELLAHVKPTDVELLYARLPADALPPVDNQEPLTADQQTLHARLIGAELERQGYHDGQ